MPRFFLAFFQISVPTHSCDSHLCVSWTTCEVNYLSQKPPALQYNSFLSHFFLALKILLCPSLYF